MKIQLFTCESGLSLLSKGQSFGAWKDYSESYGINDKIIEVDEADTKINEQGDYQIIKTESVKILPKNKTIGDDSMTNKSQALANELEVNVADVEKIDYITYIVEGAEYMVISEEERDERVEEDISESLWAFNSSFMSSLTGIDEIVFQALADKYESANEGIKDIIEATCGMEKFIEEAVSADGYGHFLSHYDGRELELDGDLYAYRTN